MGSYTTKYGSLDIVVKRGRLSDVGGPSKKEEKVVVLRELCRAIIYSTKIGIM
jgi:hypothetical protein